MIETLRRFLLPEFSRGYFLRVLLVAVGAYCFFKFVCIPAAVRGSSMQPTYSVRSFTFCWTPSYMFSEPDRFDVVTVRFAGTRVMLLKRVVALEGETVSFRGGRLLVNGTALEEPYVKYPCDWDLSPRTVDPGHVYVVGDNRSMPISQHRFGQTPLDRIIGKPLW